MPLVVSPVDVRLHAEIGGHTAMLKAGIPTQIPDALLEVAYETGCSPADAPPEPEAVPTPEQALSVSKTKKELKAERAELIREVIKTLVLRGNADDFTKIPPHGPRIAKVNARLTFLATSQEVLAVWDEFLEAAK